MTRKPGKKLCSRDLVLLACTGMVSCTASTHKSRFHPVASNGEHSLEEVVTHCSAPIECAEALLHVNEWPFFWENRCAEDAPVQLRERILSGGRAVAPSLLNVAEKGSPFAKFYSRYLLLGLDGFPGKEEMVSPIFVDLALEASASRAKYSTTAIGWLIEHPVESRQNFIKNTELIPFYPAVDANFDSNENLARSQWWSLFKNHKEACNLLGPISDAMTSSGNIHLVTALEKCEDWKNLGLVLAKTRDWSKVVSVVARLLTKVETIVPRFEILSRLASHSAPEVRSLAMWGKNHPQLSRAETLALESLGRNPINWFFGSDTSAFDWVCDVSRNDCGEIKCDSEPSATSAVKWAPSELNYDPSTDELVIMPSILQFGPDGEKASRVYQLPDPTAVSVFPSARGFDDYGKVAVRAKAAMDGACAIQLVDSAAAYLVRPQYENAWFLGRSSPGDVEPGMGDGPISSLELRAAGSRIFRVVQRIGSSRSKISKLQELGVLDVRERFPQWYKLSTPPLGTRKIVLSDQGYALVVGTYGAMELGVGDHAVAVRCAP